MNLQLVELTWEDAQSAGAHTWIEYDDSCKTDIASGKICKTVGYLLPESNKLVVAIAGSLSLHKGEINEISGHLTVPRGMVRKIRELK